MASLVSEEPEIPTHLQCPITLSLMRNPVTASDGQTYEKEAIEKWMEGHDNSSPFTREPITSINPNFAIKNLCEQFMLSNETLLTKELMEMEEKIKNKKEKIKKLREKREEEQKLRKIKEEEDARRLEELKSMNPLPINFCTMTINGTVYSSTTTTTTTITSNSIPDENGNIDCTNCVGCKNCIGCVDCVDCHGCTGCTNCNGCIRCTGCVNCKYCGSCTGCTGCDHCQKCTGCALCKKCEDCINCHSCIMMKHVKNHRVYR